MGDTIKTTFTIEQNLLTQAEALAQELDLTPDALLSTALEQFIKHHKPPVQDERVINQGDIYWLKVSGADVSVSHPHVVIQDNLLNHSRVNTVVLCALTSNIKRINIPGNILLNAEEANLPRQSVIEVSKLTTVEKSQLGDYIGTLSESRIEQIIEGLRFVQASFLRDK